MLTSPDELKIGDYVTICETITRQTLVKVPDHPFMDTPDYKILNDVLVKRQVPVVAGIPFKVAGIALPMIMLECQTNGLFAQLPPIIFVNCQLNTFCVIPRKYIRKYKQYYNDRGLAGHPVNLDKAGKPIEQLVIVEEGDEEDLQKVLDFLKQKNEELE